MSTIQGTFARCTRSRTAAVPITQWSELQKIAGELQQHTASFLDQNSLHALAISTKSVECTIIQQSQESLKVLIQAKRCTSMRVYASAVGALSVRKSEEKDQNDATIWQSAIQLKMVLDDDHPPSLWYDAFKNAPKTTKIVLCIHQDMFGTLTKIGTVGPSKLMEYELPTFDVPCLSGNQQVVMQHVKEEVFAALSENRAITDLEIEMCLNYQNAPCYAVPVLSAANISQILMHTPNLTKLSLTNVSLADIACLGKVTNWPTSLKTVALNTCNAYHCHNGQVVQFHRLPLTVFNGIPDSVLHIAFIPGYLWQQMRNFDLEADDTTLLNVKSVRLWSNYDGGYMWHQTLQNPKFLPALQKVYTGELDAWPLVPITGPDTQANRDMFKSQIESHAVAVVVQRGSHPDTSAGSKQVVFHYSGHPLDYWHYGPQSLEEEEPLEEQENKEDDQILTLLYRLQMLKA
jgi:hypothetical protein